MNYDAVVIGLGGMGSATVAELARRGLRVLGLEQFDRGHALGSSHGHSRIIRTAYFEHPDYVPLCRAAFAGWYDLEQRTGKQLLIDCPCLTLGPPTGELVAGVQDAARKHNLKIDSLDHQELARLYPQFQLPPSLVGVLEHASAVLLVDDIVRAMQDEAIRNRAELRFGEGVIEWKAIEKGVAVRTTWDSISAGTLFVTAGSWTGKILSGLNLPLTVMRQVPLWFRPREPAKFRRDRFPIFIIEAPNGNFYGMPMLDPRGIKAARHYVAPELHSPDQVQRDVSEDDERPIRQFLQSYIPDAAGTRSDASVCLYTLTPDRHFIIDRHPEYPNVAIAAGFSGHGFKFAPVVAEILADLATTGRSSRTIQMFDLNRLK